MRVLKIIFTLSILFVSFSYAQVVYHDASKFTLIGKLSNDTETLYERLPTSLKEKTRKAVWGLGKNTAGLAIRFSTNSSSISVKWTLLEGTIMSHMALTGIKGLDLYSLVENKWDYVGTAIPSAVGKENEKRIVYDMISGEKEFMLYLPLYDGVTDIKIGIDNDAKIEDAKVNKPATKMPIVVYGTSIAQGGCASRPGMAYTSILSRWLDREIINLGFSGNGLLDSEIADVIAIREAELYIIDQMPNMTMELVHERLEIFYKKIRERAPLTPIMFVEQPVFPASVHNLSKKEKDNNLNLALYTVFNRLKEYDTNLYLVSSKGMIGIDNEATVDGQHFTDLGFMRYAEYLLPKIELLLRK